MTIASDPFRVAASHVEQMRQATLYADGALSARTKVMAAMLWSVCARCEPCAAHYARKAVELGASREELAEMLAVASTMGGCVGETWALKAFAAAREADESGSGNASEERCCTDDPAGSR